MSELMARIRVVLGAAVTYLTLASVALTIFSEEIAGLLPVGTAEQFSQWVIVAVGWLGASVSIIRRVSPVLPEERGLLGE